MRRTAFKRNIKRLVFKERIPLNFNEEYMTGIQMRDSGDGFVILCEHLLLGLITHQLTARSINNPGPLAPPKRAS